MAKDKQAVSAKKAVNAAAKNKNVSKTEAKFLKEMLTAAKADGNVTKKELAAIKKEVKAQKDKGKGIAAYKVGNAAAYLKWRVGKGPKPQPATPVNTTTASAATNLVDGVNLKEVYQAEVNRLTLSLIKQSESLLLAYDFKGIDFAPSYYLETDDSAKNTKVYTKFNRPKPSEGYTTAYERRYNIGQVLNEIVKQIGDNSTESKIHFGTQVGNVFYQGKTTISGNTATFDLQLTNITIPGATKFRIRLYDAESGIISLWLAENIKYI